MGKSASSQTLNPTTPGCGQTIMHTSILVLSLLPLVAAHGSIVHPPPRNAIDSNLAPWNGTMPIGPSGEAPFEPWCPVPNFKMPDSPAGRLSSANGQACFWFSSGCSIGCDKCDGQTRGPIPGYPCQNLNNKSEMCAKKMSVCEEGKNTKPTIPKETCQGCEGGKGGKCASCRCTGEFGPANMEIVDHVALPWMLPEGDYVVGWRWDCEESNQVWNACSDVTIKAFR